MCVYVICVYVCAYDVCAYGICVYIWCVYVCLCVCVHMVYAHLCVQVLGPVLLLSKTGDELWVSYSIPFNVILLKEGPSLNLQLG